MYNHLTTRDICEYLVRDNIQNIRSKIIVRFSYLSTFIIYGILYMNGLLFQSQYLFLYMLINILTVLLIFVSIQLPIMTFYLNYLKRHVLKNWNRFFEGVDPQGFADAYYKSLKHNIKDQNLLEFLKKYSNKE